MKVEINIAEHQSLFDLKKYPFAVANSWFSGEVEIVSFDANELFGTKLRAFLQRRKNRDLFDLHEGLQRVSLDPEKIVATLHHYLSLEQKTISRAEAEQRVLEKFSHDLIEDVVPLLPVGITFTTEAAVKAIESIWHNFILRMTGSPWKLTPDAMEEIRKKTPSFLK